METKLRINNRDVPLDDFTQTYVGHVAQAVMRSLGHESHDITVHIDDAGLRIYKEKGEVPVTRDLAESLIESTIKGALSPLRGVTRIKRVMISTRIPHEKNI